MSSAVSAETKALPSSIKLAKSLALRAFECDDLVLNGVAGNEPVHHNIAILADAVGTVDGLGFVAGSTTGRVGSS